ncbi:MAG: LysR family transcriptional regulator, partial [Steroidobacteraceae bacterium]
HSLAFPSFAGTGLTVNIGWLGLQHVLTHGGTGYFPARLVRDHEISGQLHRVAGAPEFRLPAYLCFPSKTDPGEPLALAVETLRRVAADAA